MLNPQVRALYDHQRVSNTMGTGEPNQLGGFVRQLQP